MFYFTYRKRDRRGREFRVAPVRAYVKYGCDHIIDLNVNAYDWLFRADGFEKLVAVLGPELACATRIRSALSEQSSFRRSFVLTVG